MTQLKNHHWLNGIDEYLTRINHVHAEQFKQIPKAIHQGNIWSIRNMMLDLIKEGTKTTSKANTNLLLSHYLPDYEPTEKQLLRFTHRYVDDGFLVDIYSWLERHQHLADLNLDDHFSRGQIKSKLWMMEELRNVVSGNELGIVVLYGGWYATIAHFFFKFFSPSKLYSIDLDSTTVDIADGFNIRHGERNEWQFKAFAQDVNSITYDEEGKFTLPDDDRLDNLTIKPTVVINTSCEHMNEEWFYNLPDGQFVALQTNDYFANEQHTNCVNGINEALAKYKFSEVYFSGELDTQLYNRFMIIGKK